MFGLAGSWSEAQIVPPGFAGLQATFASLGFTQAGGFAVSNLETITFL